MPGASCPTPTSPSRCCRNSSPTFRRRTSRPSSPRPTPTAVYSNGRADSDFTQITPLRTLEAGLAHPRTVQRPDAGVQGHGDAVARQPVRVCAGQTARRAEHPRRDFGRHRLRRRIRDARQARHPRVHAVAARQDVGVPARADVLAAGPEHLQHRDQRHVRRRAGHGEGGVQRPRVQGEVQDRHGQLDQLGARVGADRVLLQGLFRRDAIATTSRSRSRCRPATSATSAPATSRA